MSSISGRSKHRQTMATLRRRVAALQKENAALRRRIAELQEKENRRKPRVRNLASCLEILTRKRAEGLRDKELAKTFKLTTRQIRYRLHVAKKYKLTTREIQISAAKKKK